MTAPPPPSEIAKTGLARFFSSGGGSKPRLLLAGAQSGSGKTSAAIGLTAALVKRGLNVQPYKVGPDYIDPAFHSFVAGRQSRNLDSWLLTEETVRALFLKNAPDEGLSLIEGAMGLFDGHLREPVGSPVSSPVGEPTGSSAHIARILGAPVILIVNASGLARSAAALVQGFDRFDPGLKLAGVIFNQTSSPGHYEILKNFTEKEAGVPCFGHLLKNTDFNLGSRHLGLVPAGETADLKIKAARLGEAAAAALDLEGLLKTASAAPPLPAFRTCRAEPLPSEPPLRLGLALDAAFNFYYQDGLDLLTALGAELCPFSPLKDAALPQALDGLYIGGGFPEIFAAELADNRPLRRAIRAALEKGLPAYAECGGLMYLGRTLIDQAGQAHRMTNFFPITSAMTDKLKNFGYATATFERDLPLGPAGTSLRVHEFHHSRLENEKPDDYVLTIEKSPGRSWRGGLARLNVLAAYPHFHFCSKPEAAAEFLLRCREYRRSYTSGR